METGSIRTIFFGIQKPSDKSFLISIPMNLYRVRTRQFVNGLNYFQKAVLKLKTMPGMTNTEISGLLGLELRLVEIVENELISLSLLTMSGDLTQKGREELYNPWEIIVDDKSCQLAYVLSYDGGRTLYPFLWNRVEWACVSGGKLTFNGKSGEIAIEAPYNLNVSSDGSEMRPTEEDVFHLIKRTLNHPIEMEDDWENDLKICSDLRIEYLNDGNPELVNVCTYMYLRQTEEGVYENDWHVVDPFSGQDSHDLKGYLESVMKVDCAFAKVILQRFGNEVTDGDVKFSEALAWHDENVQRWIHTLWGGKYDECLSDKLKNFAYSVVNNFLRMQKTQPDKICHDNVQLFFINMQSFVEGIFLLDKDERRSLYAQVWNKYRGIYSASPDYDLYQTFTKGIFQGKLPPNVLNVKLRDKRLPRGKSLLDYLIQFILTTTINTNAIQHPLVGLFKNRIEKLTELADERNHVGHGSTDYSSEANESANVMDKINDFYNWFVDLVTDYLVIYK